jgi:PAS domain S-box-containing protein
VDRALARAFTAFRRSLDRPASAPASPRRSSGELPSIASIRRLLPALEARGIDSAWAARWCAAFFEAARGALEGGSRPAGAGLVRALAKEQERLQGLLLEAARSGRAQTAPAETAHQLRRRVGDLEAQVRRSGEEYRQLVERLGIFLFTIDAEGRIDSITGKGLRFVGLREEDVLGRDVMSFVPSNMKRQLGAMRRKLLTEKRLANVSIAMLDARGRDRVIEFDAWLLEREGRPTGAIAVARDETAQARLQVEMRRTRDRLERLIESSVDGIVTTDKAGNITLFSRGAEEMFGYSASEVMGKPVADFFGGSEPGATPLFHLIAAGGGRISNHETHVRTRAGHEIVADISASLLRDEEGEVVGYLGICKDITARRRAEEDLRRKNEELEGYVRTVSHDLRGPIMSIQGFCSLMAESCGAELPESGRYFLGRVKDSAHQMDRLICELLELSTAGNANGARYWVPVRQVLREIAEELAPQLDAAGVRLDIQEPLPQVFADETRLRQVFANLIGNALRHMGRDSGGVIEVASEPAEHGHVFSVTDNGAGVPFELQDRIFEMFYTRSQNGSSQGFGLGLAIVKKIVEAHGGHIWVESEPGNGARFYFNFPQTEA